MNMKLFQRIRWFNLKCEITTSLIGKQEGGWSILDKSNSLCKGMEIEESDDNSMFRDQGVGWWDGGEGEEDRGVWKGSLRLDAQESGFLAEKSHY